jgi:hypothetical protein
MFTEKIMALDSTRKTRRYTKYFAGFWLGDYFSEVNWYYATSGTGRISWVSTGITRLFLPVT